MKYIKTFDEYLNENHPIGVTQITPAVQIEQQTSMMHKDVPRNITPEEKENLKEKSDLENREDERIKKEAERKKKAEIEHIKKSEE